MCYFSGAPEESSGQLDTCPRTHYKDVRLRGIVEDREKSWDHDEPPTPGDRGEVSASQQTESCGRQGSARPRLTSLVKHTLWTCNSTAHSGVGQPPQLTCREHLLTWNWVGLKFLRA